MVQQPCHDQPQQFVPALPVDEGDPVTAQEDARKQLWQRFISSDKHTGPRWRWQRGSTL